MHIHNFFVSATPGPCASDPCEAGSTCVDYGTDDSGPRSYTCLCPIGRTGDNCEIFTGTSIFYCLNLMTFLKRNMFCLNDMNYDMSIY